MSRIMKVTGCGRKSEREVAYPDRAADNALRWRTLNRGIISDRRLVGQGRCNRLVH